MCVFIYVLYTAAPALPPRPRDDVDPFIFGMLPLIVMGMRCVEGKDPFTIWSNRKTLNNLKPRARKHQIVKDTYAYPYLPPRLFRRGESRHQARPLVRRHQTCDFRKHATSAPAELGGETHKTTSREIKTARRSLCRRRSCTFTEIANIMIITIISVIKIVMIIISSSISSISSIAISCMMIMFFLFGAFGPPRPGWPRAVCPPSSAAGGRRRRRRRLDCLCPIPIYLYINIIYIYIYMYNTPIL